MQLPPVVHLFPGLFTVHGEMDPGNERHAAVPWALLTSQYQRTWTKARPPSRRREYRGIVEGSALSLRDAMTPPLGQPAVGPFR